MRYSKGITAFRPKLVMEKLDRARQGYGGTDNSHRAVQTVTAYKLAAIVGGRTTDGEVKSRSHFICIWIVTETAAVCSLPETISRALAPLVRLTNSKIDGPILHTVQPAGDLRSSYKGLGFFEALTDSPSKLTACLGDLFHYERGHHLDFFPKPQICPENLPGGKCRRHSSTKTWLFPLISHHKTFLMNFRLLGFSLFFINNTKSAQ